MVHCLVPVEGELCGYFNRRKWRVLNHIRDKHLDLPLWRCDDRCDTGAWQAITIRVPNGGGLGFFLAVSLPRRGTVSNKDRKVNEGSVVE